MNQVTPHKIEVFLSRNWFQLGILLLLVLSGIRNDGLLNKTLFGNEGEPLLASSDENHTSKVYKEKMGFGFSFDADETPKKKVYSAKEDYLGAKFIKRFQESAQKEAVKFEVPASIMLGLGIYHRNSPKAFLAKKANNYFALPCTADWYGESVTHEDACYRAYKSAWFSFRDQNKFLNDLREQGIKEKKNGPYLTTGDWANLLKRNGLIRDKSKFKKLVTRFDLTRFDEI